MTDGVRARGRLAAVLGGGRPAGVYRWLSRAHPAAVRRELVTVGWATHVLDGRALTGAQPLFDRCARVLTFPLRFGHTFDALTDCLGDLSWLPEPGHLVLWDRYEVLAGSDAKAWRMAYQAFVDAISARNSAGSPPLFVLLRGPGPVQRPEGAGLIPPLPPAGPRIRPRRGSARRI